MHSCAIFLGLYTAVIAKHNKQINGYEKMKLGSYAVLSRISILADLRIFCASFGSEKRACAIFYTFCMSASPPYFLLLSLIPGSMNEPPLSLGQ